MASDDDARHITGNASLALVPGSDLAQPSTNSDDPGAPAPCQATWGGAATFVSGWAQFHSADYRGSTQPTIGAAPGAAGILDVSQAVAVYPNEGAARSAFDRLTSTLADCSAQRAKNYHFTIDQPDASTAVLGYSREDKSQVFRVRSSVLMYVGVLGTPADRPDQIARQVLQTITDRIK